MQHARRFGLAAATLALIGLINVNAGAIIVPRTLDELVAGAETIFLGRVVDTRSYWEESQSGRLILTRVVFAVERVYKGPPMIQRSLDFLGGTIGDTTLRVEGMPTFGHGDRDVLFVRSDMPAVNPLAGGIFGRFRVVSDGRGIDWIKGFDGGQFEPLTQLSRPPAETTAQSMPLAAFELQIAQALKREQR